MAYTTPPTFVASDVLEADQLNILTDDIIDLDARAHETAFMGVSLLRSSALATSDSTYTSVGWSSSPADVGGWWSSGTNIVVPAGAIPSGFTTIYVELMGQARAASNNTGTRQIQFTLNGGTIEIARSVSGINGEATSMDHVVWAEVAAADVLVMQVRQTSGGSLNWDYLTMRIKRLGPAS